jgi:hypothetical protein
MASASATKARATATAAAKRPTSAFLSDDQVDDVERDSKANDSYVGLSKLDEGKVHRFRFLGPAITGYSTWIETDGKSSPLRWRVKPEGDDIPGNLQINPKSKKPAEIKRFVCGFVWDYQKERISVLIIDQKTLLQELHGCIVDPDLGDPQEYDIKITRKVENDFTKYKLIGAPPKALLPDIEEAYEALLASGADLDVMFDNGNPFEPEAKKDGDEEEEDDEDKEGDEEE